jgi:hypothetical protein
MPSIFPQYKGTMSYLIMILWDMTLCSLVDSCTNILQEHTALKTEVASTSLPDYMLLILGFCWFASRSFPIATIIQRQIIR